MELAGLESLLDRLRPDAEAAGAELWLGRFSRDVLGRDLDLFFRQSRGLKRGAAAEAVHDMRVTARRLSEYLALAAPVAPAPLSLAGREFLDGFTRILSPIRNADVPRDFLHATLQMDLSAYERDAAVELQRRLLERREHKLELALDFFKRGQTRNRLADLARLRRGLSRSGAALKARFPEALSEHLSRRLEKVRADAGAALAAASAALPAADLDHVLHAFRRDVRLLRYSADAARGASGRPRASDVRRARRIQQVLGEHHDLSGVLKRVARAKEALSGKEPGAAGLLRGFDRLATRYSRRQAACLGQFRGRLQGTP